MTEIAAQPEPNWRRDAYGILALSIAFLLILALGDWPYAYYKFLRIVTCLFCATVAYRAYQTYHRGWLLFAVFGVILFNPVVPFINEKGDWSLFDLAFAIGYGAYGIGSLNRKVSKVICVIAWLVFVMAFGATYYVNFQMPHGPYYPTRDIVCQNEDRGPCGDEYKEDMRGLDIPSWAKFLRENLVFTFTLLPVAGICLGSKGWGEDDPPEEFDWSTMDDDIP